MERTRSIPERFFRPANDSVRPMATVELALKVRPAPVVAGQAPAWRLDPVYREWARRSFPRDRLNFAPLDLYDEKVRAETAVLTLEELDAMLSAEMERSGGYALQPAQRWRGRTAMFVVGSLRARALIEFLFAFG